jgi:hypothetical protein
MAAVRIVLAGVTSPPRAFMSLSSSSDVSRVLKAAPDFSNLDYPVQPLNIREKWNPADVK